MNKNKMRLILALIFGITFIFLIIFKDNSYSKVYDINEYKITEEFNDKKEYYYFQIKYKNKTYEFIEKHKYIGKKNIENIEIKSNEDEICLIISNKITEKKLLCSIGNEMVNWNIVSSKLQNELPSELIKKYSENGKEVNDFTIYNNIEKKLYLWNYKGFDIIDNGTAKYLQIFDEDVYDTKHITRINNYIVMPDYSQKYNFNKLIIIDTTSDEITYWPIDYEISYDSYVMGTYDKSIYLIDNKNKIQYELVPHKQKIRIIAKNSSQGVIYDNSWQKKKVSEIINNELYFNYNTEYLYNIEEKKLLLSYTNLNNKIRISNNDITKIVSVNNQELIYLSGNQLFYFSPTLGECLLIIKDEWLFNNENKIFMIF